MKRVRRGGGSSARAPLALVAAISSTWAGSCADDLEPLPASSPIGLALAEIRAHEDALRASRDFTAVVGRHRALGPDPYLVVAAPRGSYVGLLRGEDATVLLDAELHEVARASAPALASALAVDGDDVWVGGEGSSLVSRFGVLPSSLDDRGVVSLGEGTSVRGLAAEGGVAFAVDAVRDALVAFDASGELARVTTASSPLRVVATPRWVVVASLVGHRIEVFARDERGLPTEPSVGVHVRRGPAWALDAAEDDDGGLWIAAGAVEDADLDRTIGAFGNVDSVVELLRLGEAGLTRVASVDVSDRGLVVPKSIAIVVSHDDLRVRTIGAAGPRGLDLAWHRDGARLVLASEVTWPAIPGTASFVGGPGAPVVAASPLFDAFWTTDPAGDPRRIALARVGSIASRTPSASERLGEALLTTELLAPGQTSEGPYSRFTCETCHFELGIDGRTHLTGREDDTAATTKPLYGMLENGPHFTRALDRDLTEVAHNEVRVANLHVATDPWFAIDRGRAPWLGALVGDDARPELFGPLGVRKAMVDTFAALAHRPSLEGRGRTTFSAVERRGAELFRSRCASCHAARLVTNDAATEVPFEAWEGLIFSDAGPITWARDGYEATGVEPYVNEAGARTTSLRRAIEKRPYFTNGSAATLEEVVARSRFAPGVFLHVIDGPAARREVDPATLAGFGDADVEALVAFIRLL